MIFTDDLGTTWSQVDVGADAAMAFDVHFFDRAHGVIAASSNADVASAHALILTTADGGTTWTRAFETNRPYEITWKISFPTRDTGYVTIQSYDPDPRASRRSLAKTTDGGQTWFEIPLVDDHAVRQFGIAFIDADRGWVGAMPGGFETSDGGRSWQRTEFGNAVNKIRVLRDRSTILLYAIGVDVHTLAIEIEPAQ